MFRFDLAWQDNGRRRCRAWRSGAVIVVNLSRLHLSRLFNPCSIGIAWIRKYLKSAEVLKRDFSIPIARRIQQPGAWTNLRRMLGFLHADRTMKWRKQ